ncbi:MAG: stage II sporulation protein M [Candidatus Nanohaloarchaea archaeon]
MIPEFILREEEDRSLGRLFVLGLASSLTGILLAVLLFPDDSGFASVAFASLPLVYPLMTEFLDDEKEKRPHVPEIMIYGALFAGEAAGFFLAALHDPSVLEMQVSVFEIKLGQLGVTGYAIQDAGTAAILANNLMVFSFILLASSLIGSAGAFIISWNASVLGAFLGVITREMPSTRALLTGYSEVPPPVAYVPHASLEMSGFVVAGIAGSMISASVYRRHFDRETWIDLAKLVLTGLALLLSGAFLETGMTAAFLVSAVAAAGSAAWMR